MVRLFLLIILLSTPAPAQTQPGGRATTRPTKDPDAVEKVRLWSGDELKKGLLDKLGRDVIDDAAFSVYLWGYQRRFVPKMLPKYLMQAGRDQNGKVNRGFLVKPSDRNYTVTWNNDVAFVTLTGTIWMYVPGKAAAVDYVVTVRPTPMYFSEDEPSYYSTTGSVKWSNLRDAPYSEDVWDQPPQTLNDKPNGAAVETDQEAPKD